WPTRTPSAIGHKSHRSTRTIRRQRPSTRSSSRRPLSWARTPRTHSRIEETTRMRRLTFIVAVLMALTTLVSGAQGARKLRVVTTIPDLRSLTEAVGGDLVEVDSLTRGTQNFHEAEVRPSMMLKLRRADVLIENGLDPNPWAGVARHGPNHPDTLPGAAAHAAISRRVPTRE